MAKLGRKFRRKIRRKLRRPAGQLQAGFLALLLIGAIAWAPQMKGVRAFVTNEHPTSRAVMIIDPGWIPRAPLDTMIRDEVSGLALKGFDTDFFVVDSGSGASMTPLTLGEAANYGNFVSDAGNGTSREREQREWGAAAQEEVLSQVNSLVPGLNTADPSGVDLVGALDAALRRLTDLDADATAEIILVTGGGVHRTSDFDLRVADPSTFGPWLPNMSAVDRPDDVLVRIVGEANFPDVSPTPARDFVTNVERFWADRCSDLVAAGAQCELA